jgi:hypothetical protein
MLRITLNKLILLLIYIFLTSPTIAQTSNQQNTLVKNIKLDSLQIPLGVDSL